jgi:large subunit ribosomal protein L17
MRHLRAGKKLGRTSSHRKALFRNQIQALFKHDSIITTVAKAKAVRPRAEKLITKAKMSTLHAHRQVLRELKDKEVVKRLFDVIAVKYENRNGGYTRILKLSRFRPGDGAPLASLELVEPYHVESDETATKEKSSLPKADEGEHLTQISDNGNDEDKK